LFLNFVLVRNKPNYASPPGVAAAANKDGGGEQ
jgi:hypothetical protein